MDRDNNLRSSDIRDLVYADDQNEVDEESESDIEAEDVPDDVSLHDFSSGSGEEYVPDIADISSSEYDSDQDMHVPPRPRPITPVVAGPSTNPAPIPLGPPIRPSWVRVHPPEPEVDIGPSFLQRNTGPRNMPPKNSSPITYFYLFFTMDVLDHIKRHTNYYANKKINDKIASNSFGRHSRLQKWVDVTLDDMKKFLGILINMGLTIRKNMTAYWDTRPSQHIPFYSKTMARNKFFLINTHLHLTLAQTRRRGDPGFDPWSKVRYILDHLNKMFKNYFVPSQNVCIDESLVGMKNRCAFIQYMPKKKHARYGIKKFEVCDSTTSYIVHTELYSGSTFLQGNPHPFTEKVILTTMEKSNLLNKYYHVFVDQFYTKLPLAKKLFDKKTYLTGTVNKASKHLCKTTLNQKLGACESIYCRQEEVLMVGFRQKANRKPVYVLTTACHAEDRHVVSKKGLNGVKPLVIHKYNQYMGGVDVSDKSIYHTSCSRTTSKYWKKLFFNFIDMSLFNAYVLYKLNTDRPMSRKEFLVSVVNSLTEPQADIPQPVAGPGGDAPCHILTHLPGQLSRFCEICKEKNIKKRSRFWCPACNIGVHRECFHMLQHYWRPLRPGRKRKASSGSASD